MSKISNIFKIGKDGNFKAFDLSKILSISQVIKEPAPFYEPYSKTSGMTPFQSIIVVIGIEGARIEDKAEKRDEHDSLILAWEEFSNSK